MNAASRDDLSLLYCELREADYEPGSSVDWALGFLYDRIGDDLPLDKTRPEDLDAYRPFEDLGAYVNYAKEKPAEKAAQKRAQDIIDAKHRAYLASRAAR